MGYVVEKDIPIPKVYREGRRKVELRLTLELLDVGESILVSDKSKSNIRNTILAVGRDIPSRAYTTRTVDGGVRVWRTK